MYILAEFKWKICLKRAARRRFHKGNDIGIKITSGSNCKLERIRVATLEFSNYVQDMSVIIDKRTYTSMDKKAQQEYISQETENVLSFSEQNGIWN